jgi:hypothetical protein
MKSLLTIAAKIDQPQLLEHLVEKLACRRYDIGYANEKVPTNYQALETSTSPIYLSGVIEMNENNEQLNIPYITSFLFTCTKASNASYKLAWASSLS